MICTFEGILPCFAEQCNTPQSGWDAHSWRSPSRWGCWCPHQGPRHAHCSGLIWPEPSRMPSLWQSIKNDRLKLFYLVLWLWGWKGLCVHVYVCANLFSRLVAGCAGHPDVPQAHRWGVLYGSSRIQVLAAVHDAALQFFHDHLSHVFGQSFAMPSQLILCSWDSKNTASLQWKANGVYCCTLYAWEEEWLICEVICDQRVTWNAFALDSFGNDGSRLMACVAQGLAELLHAVSIHNDSVPTRRTKTHVQSYILH